MKKSFTFLCALLMGLAVQAQVQPNATNAGQVAMAGNLSQPFLFTVNTLTGDNPYWHLNYSGSYGERVAGPFGYNGVDQQFAVKGYLGNRFTLFANAAFGFARTGGMTSSQQAEVIRDVIGGKQLFGPSIGIGLGVSRDMSNVKAMFSRVTAYFNTAAWRVGGNMRFEKAFDSSRDDIDLVTSVGFHHRIAGNLYAGVEAVGEDLEGFWEEDEAEGGAKLLVGPSLNMVPANSRFAFSVCGGPVFYATRSRVAPSEAIRDIGTIASQNGFTLRAMVTFNLHK
ncbi:hypothetical protein KHS38_06580 [Mucilaginibacter sp. Bleaf8]|uniref:hypothetical protein n=1 Tax=Mucilaginibacter sp. Bleaf8 TaxID=2834430 RepID=UPI001BCECF2B|nr:hypothetical protein [Mucilaginibacter sp. Bleaf8]MBS7564067.1 hypothetical protein [Mucilaginibacter sp. Bleaf8]